MKKLLICLIAVVLALPLGIWAQTYTVYNSDNSDLPVNQVYNIDFDRNGNIWFGGQRDPATGLAQVSMLSWDLSGWTVYEYKDAALSLDVIDGDRVYYIKSDDRNTKWFSTHYGISYLKADGTTGVVNAFLGAYDRSVFVDYKGTIYVSIRESDRSLSRIYVSEDYGETWGEWSAADIGFTMSTDDIRPEIYDLRYDSMGRLWICTWYGVTYRDLDGVWHFIAETEDVYTHAMTRNWDDHMWVADVAYDSGPVAPTVLLEILPDGTVVEHGGTEIPELDSWGVTDLEVDANGHLWCATNGGGLIEILPDLTYNVYTSASTGGGLPEDTFYHMEIREGVIWLASADSGVVRIGLADLISMTGVIEEKDNTVQPDGFDLYANYPNPFNPSTQITFDLNGNAEIELAVYSIRGERIAVLAAGRYSAGRYQLTWDGRDQAGQAMPSGVYIYRLKSERGVFSRKMMLLK
jgi:hypothetical protein